MLKFKVIVHTAVRSKVPLKKKVRGERSKSKYQSEATAFGAIKDKNVSPLSTTNVTKRSKHSSDSPRKLLKKKKKRASGADENRTEMETLPVKPSRKLKKKSKHKEVIDYSNIEHTVNHTNTFGKVQKWLLESPIVSNNTPSQIEHSSKTTNILSKSQSTPEQLVLNQLLQINTSSQSNPKVKTKSVGNLNEKVRLQVVYKPPFKLSLKLSKNENNVNTSIVKADKRKTRLERKRATATITEEPQKNRRTALLIRTNTDDAANEIEPNYETLNSKLKPSNQRQLSQTAELPNYENMTFQASPNLIESSKVNSATFRINKSGSGGNNTKNSLPVIKTPVLGIRKSPSHRGSNQNLSHLEGGSNYNSRASITNSNTNLLKFGSSQNLNRSSTSNLTKKDNVKRRGSAVNQYYRQNQSYGSNSNLRGSTSNLRREGSSGDIHFGDDYGSGDRRGHSRRNSTNLSSSRNNLPRTLSNNNLNTGSRRGSFSSIPRASLISPISSNEFQRQTSLNIKSKVMCDDNHRIRPQTASCEPMNNFEWPKMYSPDEILPSDMEVMCSDVENLVGDS